ncbi:MAG: hypothetical protein QM734_07670 [Cyclobacteriaceae bacterium]
MPKKVLIITYYWPPAGGIAVQRWMKFVKYFRENNWEPIVYTVEDANYPIIDQSKIKDVPDDILVIKRPIWEPHKLYHFLLRKKKKVGGRDDINSKERASIVQKISIWFRGNFFIPDARAMWIKPSTKFLSEYLKSNPVDAIVSAGPPHSTHLIAMGITRKLNIPWLADFRDPWVSMDYYKDLMLTSWADKKHRRLELEVLRKANVVTVIGHAMQTEFLQKGANVHVVTNGFDEEDFKDDNVILDESFTIVHVGSILKNRNPVAFWKALAELKKENHSIVKSVVIRLIGKADESTFQSIKENDLESFLEVIGAVPQPEAIKKMKAAQVLLLPIDNFEGAKWVITGKMFEYIASKRPVLCIGPVDGDAASILSIAKSGVTFGFDDVQGIKRYLIELHRQFESKNLKNNTNNVLQFSYRHLAKEMTQLLNSIV